MTGIIWGTIFSSFSGMISTYITNLIHFLKSLFVATVTISEEVEYYDFLFEFFSKQKIISSTQKHIQRHKSNIADRYVGMITQTNESDTSESYSLVDDKMHIIWFQKRVLLVSKIRPMNYNSANEAISIQIPFGSSTFIEQMISSIKNEYKKNTEDIHIRVFNQTRHTWMNTVRPKRDIKSVILTKDIKESITNDIAWFFDNKNWYRSKDLHYHRGYLFAGPPGTGKSSLVISLAGQFDMKVYNFPIDILGNQGLIYSILNTIEKNSIILIEDVDRLTTLVEGSKEKKDKDKDEDDVEGPSDWYAKMMKAQTKNEMAFRNLLQIMDGLQTPESVIFVLTANEPEKIDPTLLRSGRIDKRSDFQYASPWQAKHMFLRFFQRKLAWRKSSRRSFSHITLKTSLPPNCRNGFWNPSRRTMFSKCFQSLNTEIRISSWLRLRLKEIIVTTSRMKTSNRNILNASEKSIIVNLATNRQVTALTTSTLNHYYPGYSVDTGRHPVFVGGYSAIQAPEKIIHLFVTRGKDVPFNSRFDRTYESEQHRLNHFSSGLNNIPRKQSVAIAKNFGVPYVLNNAMMEKYIDVVQKWEIASDSTLVMYNGDIPN